MKVKICGLRTLEAAQTAERAGADFLGFILWPKSRRYVSASQTGSIVQAVRERAMTVGVVVDQSLEEVVDLARRCRFNAIQLHGHESEEYVEYVKRTLDRPVIKAFKADEEGALEKALHSSADYVMIDSGAGSGKKFDWSILKDFKRDYFLAGGLDPDSVEEAIRMLEPYAVDVSSGVETDGIKDEKKIESFIKAVKHGGRYA